MALSDCNCWLLGLWVYHSYSSSSQNAEIWCLCILHKMLYCFQEFLFTKYLVFWTLNTFPEWNLVFYKAVHSRVNTKMPKVSTCNQTYVQGYSTCDTTILCPSCALLSDNKLFFNFFGILLIKAWKDCVVIRVVMIKLSLFFWCSWCLLTDCLVSCLFYLTSL